MYSLIIFHFRQCGKLIIIHLKFLIQFINFYNIKLEFHIENLSEVFIFNVMF